MSLDEPSKRSPAGQTDTPKARWPRRARCVVVGIGGSAGSLRAFSQLLAHLPPDTGMAFVIVSHLDPEHPSQLTRLLAGRSSIPVVEVTNNVRLLADHVYVQPPGADVTLVDGHLRLTPRSTAHDPHMPIDAFLRSLAAEQERRSIAVILSGAASDGAIGLTEIKAAGGVVFAQEPSTAEFPSMPSNAIASGIVDFILPPEEIAAELAAMAGHAYLSHRDRPTLSGTGQRSEGDALAEVFAMLRTAVGVDFSGYKLSTVRRRLARRMLLHRLDDIEAYVHYLREHPDEIEALQSDLLITVTEFFRDPETFEILRTRVLPDLLRRKEEGAAVRLWVPGCASGEEAYSLAITAIEAMAALGISRPLKVFATDISERELQTARRGLYPQAVAGAIPPDILRRHFLQADTGYRVSKALRDVCVFARHDLTRDPPFPRLDLVSCRNVLIYMNTALQRQVLTLLHYALLPEACLILGRAESVGNLSSLFDVVDRTHKVFVRKAGSAPMAPHYALTPADTDEHADRLHRPQLRASVQDEAERALLADYVPPGVTVDDAFEIVRFSGDTTPFLRYPPGRPTGRLLELVPPDLREDLSSALAEAKEAGHRVVRRGLRLADDVSVREVNVHVVPFASAAGEAHCVVLFEEVSRRLIGEIRPGRPQGPKTSEAQKLRRELAATRDRLEALIEEKEAANEELRAANEEVLSSGEEMQSINEELETSAEELKSTNEELESRNAELWRLADDLNNLLNSVRLPVVMVDRDRRVRRVTPEAERLFRVDAGELGRPVADLAVRIGMADLEVLLGEAIDGIASAERTVHDAVGRRYTAQVRPYSTADHHIEGAVLTLTDIDALAGRYESQLRIATTLQDNFRHPLPAIRGLELAALSLPAGRDELVGGDFRDVYALPDGQVIVLIGDVMGKGVKAAGLTETVRSAVRTSALVRAAPEFILNNVNRLLVSDEQYCLLVTVCLAVLDPATGHGSVASAGHPPPVHIRVGECRLLEPSYGTPLGAFDLPCQPLDFTLAPDEALVLYTDGVTEARSRGKLFGERRLLDVLGAAQSREPEHLVERLREAVVAYAGEFKDDVQLLALRKTE